MPHGYLIFLNIEVNASRSIKSKNASKLNAAKLTFFTDK